MNSNSTTIDTVKTDFQKHLETIASQDDIVGHVAREALNYHDPIMYLDDLLRYGCVTGMVDKLYFYNETHAFFDKHYDEIQELKEDWEDSVGEALKINGDIKNFLAWFAFEEVAYRLASEWEVV